MDAKQKTAPARAQLRARALALWPTFLFGAVGYGALELAWRGYTHWTMLVLGGICLCILQGLSRWPLPLLAASLAGAGIITGLELAVGLICNQGLHWGVWDYTGLWGNVWGQICPYYSMLWFLLCLPLLALMRAADRRSQGPPA